MRFQPHLAGCGQFAPRGFAAQDLKDALEDACARFSFTPSCPEAVGACVAGRCGARMPRRDRPCLEARQALARALPTEVPCAADRDCGVSLEANPFMAASSQRAARFGRELHAVHDACRGDEDLPPLGRDEFLPVTCTQSRCVLGTAQRCETPSTCGEMGPREVEQGCVARTMVVPPEVQGVRGEVTVKFLVSARGVPQSFSFSRVEGVSDRTRYAVAFAISRCAWRPGRQPDGKAVSMWVKLPVRFEPG